MHDGLAYLHGVSAAELKNMPRSEVEAMIEKTMRLDNLTNYDGKIELGNYLRTLDNVRDRLKSESKKD